MVGTDLPPPENLPAHQRSRTNQLLLAAMQPIRSQFDNLRQGIDPLRIGVVIGTSTSGIAEGETDLATHLETGSWPQRFDYQRQEMANAASMLADLLGIQGPAMVISTACSSGAKALASARRLLRANLCDLVVAGGVDSLCQLTVQGFSALEAISDRPCLPFSANREGINIGEGAALFLLSREPGPVCLSGVGESSDAHHFSAPHPQGDGAASAMSRALEDAQLEPGDIGYLNLHGTATRQNDLMESRAVARVLGTEVPCSSTKGYTGHTLGAAGAIEAMFCWLSLTHPKPALPPHLWDNCRDLELEPINLVLEADQGTTDREPLKRAMSNSFAFGGNNISLIMERTGQ
jgi:3-oxoacyl-[acyl-carrier-protein] synthase-1